MPDLLGVATYDWQSPTSAKDTVRRRVADTDMTRAIWTDAEINAALTDQSNIALLAAAQLLMDAATDAARQAKIIRLGTDSWDLTRLPQAFRESATALREEYARLPGTAPIVKSNDAVFTMTSDDGATLGTMEVW